MSQALTELLDILTRLRDKEDGCPWCLEQTHKSLAHHFLEETYEAVETIDKNDMPSFKDEMGDVLLQIVLHAKIAEQNGDFDFNDVAQAIVDKLTRRYPTILGDDEEVLTTPEQIDTKWEEIKAQERKAKGIEEKEASILDDISPALPALIRAEKVKNRAARAGWEWTETEQLLDKITEELDELKAEVRAGAPEDRVKDELGDVLFTVVDFARWHGISAEDALRTTTNRIENRFRHMESGLRSLGKDFKTSTREERMRFWNEMKQREKDEKKTA